MTMRAQLMVLLTGLAMVAHADSTSPMVAKIGDVTLTEEQMNSELGTSLYDVENNLYQVKRNWIDQKAKQILFDQAAKDAKLSRPEWETKEINSHIAMPSEDEIQKTLTMYGGQLPN